MPYSYHFKWKGPYSFNETEMNIFKNSFSNTSSGIYLFSIGGVVHYIGKSTKNNYSIFNRVMEHYHGILSGREKIFDKNSKLICNCAKYPSSFNTIFDLEQFKDCIVNKAFEYLSNIKIFHAETSIIDNYSVFHFNKKITEKAERYMIFNYLPKKMVRLNVTFLLARVLVFLEIKNNLIWIKLLNLKLSKMKLIYQVQL